MYLLTDINTQVLSKPLLYTILVFVLTQLIFILLCKNITNYCNVKNVCSSQGIFFLNINTFFE